MFTTAAKKTCPSCGKRIQRAAFKCAYCGEFMEGDLDRDSTAQAAGRPQTWPSRRSLAALACGGLAWVPTVGWVFAVLAVLAAIAALRQSVQKAGWSSYLTALVGLGSAVAFGMNRLF